MSAEPGPVSCHGTGEQAVDGDPLAADKYPAPAPAVPNGKTCVITLNQPTTSRDANNYVLVSADGKYNYDNAWQFDNIAVRVNSTEPGGAQLTGPTAVITNESTLPPGGNWAAAVLIPVNVANNTAYIVQVSITVKQTMTSVAYWTTAARRPTFADRPSGDAYPETVGGVTRGVSQHSAWLTQFNHTMFQLAPSVRDCNPFVPNSPYPTGILVALGDGGVRFVSGTVSESTFWSAVTPAGGEVLGADW